MSWSIGSNLPLCELEAALDEAHKERIIMFCASIDEGPTAVDRTYPGKNANCIKIGASTWSGARLSWVSESNSQFLLPGEAPPLKTAASLASSLGKKSVAGGSNTVAATASSAAAAAAASMASGYPHRGLFGSSVATALAAGLAGVLLYCDRLLGSSRVLAPGSTPAAVQHFMPLPTPSIAAGPSPIDAGVAGPSIVRRQSDVPYVEYLRHEGKMMAAFHELSKGTHKFIQIWEELPKNPERLVWDDSEEGRASRRELELFMARFHR